MNKPFLLIVNAILAILTLVVTSEYDTFVKYFAFVYFGLACGHIAYYISYKKNIEKRRGILVLLSFANVSLAASIGAYFIAEYYLCSPLYEIIIMCILMSIGGLLALFCMSKEKAEPEKEKSGTLG